MAKLPTMSPLAVMQPNASLLQLAANPTGIGALAKTLGTAATAAGTYGKNIQDANTNNAIQQIMAAGDRTALDEQRALLSGMTGVNPLKIGEALNSQVGVLQQKSLNDNTILKNQQEQDYLKWAGENPKVLLDALGKGQLPQNMLPGGVGALTELANKGQQYSVQNRDLDIRQDQINKQNEIAQGNLGVAKGNLSLAESAERRAQEKHDNENTFKEGTFMDLNGNIVQGTPQKPANERQYRPLVGSDGRYMSPLTGDSVGRTQMFSTANKFNSDPALKKAMETAGVSNNDDVWAMMAIESNGNVIANSGSSVGLMQLKQSDIKDLAKKYKMDPNLDYMKPENNMKLGAAMLADYSKQFDGNRDAMAIAYNGGEYAGKTAYNSWLEAGKRGKVRDYIPTSFPQKGKRVNYAKASREQMYNHAVKFEDAHDEWSALTGRPNLDEEAERNRPSNRGTPQGRPAGNLEIAANAVNNALFANTGGKVGNAANTGKLDQAVANERAAVNGQSAQPQRLTRIDNAAYNKAVADVNKAKSGLKMPTPVPTSASMAMDQEVLNGYFADKGISTEDGGILQKMAMFSPIALGAKALNSNDAIEAYGMVNGITKDLPPRERLAALQSAEKYVKENKNAFGRVNEEKLRKHVLLGIQKKPVEHEQKALTNAESVLKSAAAELRSKSKGNQPLDAYMQMIDPELYQILFNARGHTGETKNPFDQ